MILADITLVHSQEVESPHQRVLGGALICGLWVRSVVYNVVK